MNMSYIEQEKERIIQELLNSNKIKPGQSIDYKYFLKLYKPYKNLMREIDFAQILGINYFNHHTLKNRGTRATVLKNFKNNTKNNDVITEKEKETILQELLDTNKIKEGQLVDYKEFLTLYEPYKTKIKELEFAEELDITYNSYLAMKRGKGARVLKNGKEKAWKNKRIIKELLNEERIKPGQSITYKYFLEIYEPYKEEISEVDFAKLLEINYSTHNKTKHGKIKEVTVLKNRAEREVEEQKEKILEDLIIDNKVKLGELIDYKKFLNLYESYKAKMTEKNFARILGISYKSIKKGETRVLGNNEKITEEEKNYIIKSILEDKKIEVGQSINYAYFLELYEQYKTKMQEKDFAKILGISDCSYKSMENIKGYETKVLFDLAEKINRIIYIIGKKSRYYSEEEINELAKKYEVDRYAIIQHVICKGKKRNVLMCIEALEKNGKIWIGETKCSKRFANKYAEIIIEETKRLTEKACSKYGSEYMKQDLASGAIEYILHKCGDIEKNFKNKENEIIGLIGARAYAFIKNRCLTNLVKQKKEFFYRNNNKRVRRDILDEEFEDKTQSDMQSKVEEKVLQQMRGEDNKRAEEKCIQILMKNVEEGLSREEALSRTGEMLDINPEEMLQILQSYMIKQNKVRQTQDGEYILGE